MVKNGGYCTKCRNRMMPDDACCYKCGTRPFQHQQGRWGWHEGTKHDSSPHWAWTMQRGWYYWQPEHRATPEPDLPPGIETYATVARKNTTFNQHPPNSSTTSVGKGKGAQRAKMTTSTTAPPPPPPGTQQHGGKSMNGKLPEQRLQQDNSGANQEQDHITEADLVELLRLQERRLPPNDPIILETKKRIEALAKARIDNMTFEQRMQSAMSRLTHKEKLHKEAVDRAARAQEVVESAQMQLLVEHDKVQILKEEYDKANSEYKLLLDEVHAKKCSAADTPQTKPGLAGLGIVIPPQASPDLKEQAQAINIAVTKLQEAIHRINVAEEQAKAAATTEADKPDENIADVRSARGEKKKPETVSISFEAPAHKRSNTGISSTGAVQVVEDESCS